MQTEHWDKLTDEQQDHLFYAIHEAREAVRERWLKDLGTPVPVEVERAVAEQCIEQLADEAASRSVAGPLRATLTTQRGPTVPAYRGRGLLHALASSWAGRAVSPAPRAAAP